MKIMIAVFTLILTGCSSVATYTHSEETHRQAVHAQMKEIRLAEIPPGCPGDMSLLMTVDPSGAISSIYLDGGCRWIREEFLWLAKRKAPFPPHNQLDGIQYTFKVRR